MATCGGPPFLGLPTHWPGCCCGLPCPFCLLPQPTCCIPWLKPPGFFLPLPPPPQATASFFGPPCFLPPWPTCWPGPPLPLPLPFSLQTCCMPCWKPPGLPCGLPLPLPSRLQATGGFS